MTFDSTLTYRTAQIIIEDNATESCGFIEAMTHDRASNIKVVSSYNTPAGTEFAIQYQTVATQSGQPLTGQTQICACNKVSKETIISCINSGHHEIRALKNKTKASTGCGGCSSKVNQILEYELSKLGISNENKSCQHFKFSPEELSDIVRVTGISTFEQLVASYGFGSGCAHCQTTIKSILADASRHATEKKKGMPWQSADDAFVTSLQKDGYYSIIPRIPGGEITSDQLIALGEVGKEFNLYTKITGGQRIDLYGAKRHQLPSIWKILIDAGLETGHANGKALRTVKSCIGTNWCRFGVQDSTRMAIQIEKRYRGIRSSHKIKMSVSGCNRECAEAKSKDFGAIATPDGWNLYLGGNGGRTPRHAELFATNLNDDELICYIDRIIVFYIRTA